MLAPAWPSLQLAVADTDTVVRLRRLIRTLHPLALTCHRPDRTCHRPAATFQRTPARTVCHPFRADLASTVVFRRVDTRRIASRSVADTSEAVVVATNRCPADTRQTKENTSTLSCCTKSKRSSSNRKTQTRTAIMAVDTSTPRRLPTESHLDRTDHRPATTDHPATMEAVLSECI